MSNENENGNENAPDSVLTVAKAAERLNVTIPRLRRMLARPDFAACVLQVERRTKTGMRTSTVLPVSVLVSLQQAFESGETASMPLEAEREQEREQSQNGNENAALVEQLRSENAFLRARLEAADVEKSELRRLMMADKNELQMLRQKVSLMITAPPVEEPVQDAQEARTDTLETNVGISALELEQAENRLKTAQETVRPKRWWEVWKRGR